MQLEHWILGGEDGHTPVLVPLMEWAKWFQDANRHVAKTDVGNYWISTVFLGIDHNWGDGPPLLFETMVFGPDGNSDLDMERYSTWEQAEAGHQAMVAKWTLKAMRAKTEEDRDAL